MESKSYNPENGKGRPVFQLGTPVDGGHQWIYPVQPEIPSYKVKDLATELYKVFPSSLGQCGFLEKVKVSTDGGAAAFADFAISKSFPPQLADEMLRYVSIRIAEL